MDMPELTFSTLKITDAISLPIPSITSPKTKVTFTINP